MGGLIVWKTNHSTRGLKIINICNFIASAHQWEAYIVFSCGSPRELYYSEEKRSRADNLLLHYNLYIKQIELRWYQYSIEIDQNYREHHRQSNESIFCGGCAGMTAGGCSRSWCVLCWLASVSQFCWRGLSPYCRAGCSDQGRARVGDIKMYPPPPKFFSIFFQNNKISNPQIQKL